MTRRGFLSVLGGLAAAVGLRKFTLAPKPAEPARWVSYTRAATVRPDGTWTNGPVNVQFHMPDGRVVPGIEDVDGVWKPVCDLTQQQLAAIRNYNRVVSHASIS